MNICIATIPSLNICIKAQRALAENAIFRKIVSIDPKLTKRGCAYGIEISCTEEQRVRSILRRVGIFPSQFLKNEEGKML
jgi:hypothetical protein